MDNQIIKLNTQEAVETAKVLVEKIADNSRIVINSQPTFELATNQLGEIKKIKNAVQEKKESITKHLNEALKNVRGLFSPIEEKITAIEGYLKENVLKYNVKLLEEKRKREQEAIEKIDKGENIDKAVKKLENTNEKIAQIKTRKITRLRIVDKNLIPIDFLEPNLTKIMDSFKVGIPVNGCKIYQEEIAINNY